MKQLLLAVTAIAASMAATSAYAEGYVGFGVGPSHFNVDCSGTTSCDQSSTGVKIFGGYKFDKNLAAELTYFDYGKSTASSVVGGVAVDGAIKASSLGLGVAYFLDLAPQWTGVGRVGIASTHTKVEGVVGGVSNTDSQSHANAYAGVGIGYELTKSMKLDGALDFGHLKYGSQSANVRVFSLGLTFGF